MVKLEQVIYQSFGFRDKNKNKS